MVGANSVHPGGRACRARGWVFVHSPSYKRFLFREGSISVIGTVESVDNCYIRPVGRGARVCMTGGASLSRIPRVCGQNLLFAPRPPSVHRSSAVIPRRSTASGPENCHSRRPIRVCENTEDRRVSLDPGNRVVVLGDGSDVREGPADSGVISSRVVRGARAGYRCDDPRRPSAPSRPLRGSPRSHLGKRDMTASRPAHALDTRNAPPVQGTRGACRAEKRSVSPPHAA